MGGSQRTASSTTLQPISGHLLLSQVELMVSGKHGSEKTPWARATVTSLPWPAVFVSNDTRECAREREQSQLQLLRKGCKFAQTATI